MSGGDDQVLDEVLGARAHADAAFTAPRLPPVGVYRRPLEIAAAGHGDSHVFDGNQIFQANLAGVLDNLGAARIAEVLLDFAQLVDDDAAQFLVGPQDGQIFGDTALDLGEFVEDLLP